MDKPEKLKLKSEDLINENVKKLGELFPEILTEIEKDGKLIKTIDVEKLKELVGDFAHKDSEIYQLTWAGKQNARRVATEPTTNTLRPLISDSIDFENTENLYIEGDNLEILKILRKSYTNSIKAIYIDPPYNTRSDFVYKDDFSMSKEDYEVVAGAVDEAGNRLIKNTGTDGRFHSNWLNMMYPRIQLAYKLLKKDGVIFISIDDNEVDNLKKACDEIFGENNFITYMPRTTRKGGKTNSHVVSENDFLLIYAKDTASVDSRFGDITTGGDNYKYKDEFYSERGLYQTKPLDVSSLTYSKKMDYIFIDKNNNKYYAGGKERYEQRSKSTPSLKDWTWRWSEEKLNFALENGFAFLKNGKIQTKIYERKTISNTKPYKIIDKKLNQKIGSLFFVNNQFSNFSSKKELDELFGSKYFEYSKPVDLLTKIIGLISEDNDIILDFFSGSATTAHAVMQLNVKDNRSHKFIMIQLPEEVEENTGAFKAGYTNICEIGKERIRRAAKKIQEENNDKDLSNVDFGFRVFYLDSSNMKNTFYNPGMIDQKTLTNFKNSIKEDRTEEDLIYQVLLDMGIPISANIEIKTIQNKKVFVVNDGWLVGCFDNEIELDLIKEIAEIKSEIKGLKTKFVFKESSFKNDSAMINAMEYLKTKVFKTDGELKSNVKVI